MDALKVAASPAMFVQYKDVNNTFYTSLYSIRIRTRDFTERTTMGFDLYNLYRHLYSLA